MNTFRENIRDKILFNLVFFGLLLIGSSVVLSTLTLGERAKIIKDIGLSSINLFGVLIAILVGIGLVSKELERRTIYTIMAKPLHRYEFLLGKYFGLTITLFVNIAIMVMGFFLVLLVEQVNPDAGLLKALLLIFVELLVMTAVAVMFSTFTTPTLSATFTLAIYVIGHLVDNLSTLAGKLPQGLTKAFLGLLYYALPNLSNFNIKGQAVHGIPVTLSYLMTAIAYGVTYGASILLLACMIFHRKDFK